MLLLPVLPESLCGLRFFNFYSKGLSMAPRPTCARRTGRLAQLLLLVVVILTFAESGADSDTLNKGGTIRAPGVLVSGGGGGARLQVQTDGNMVVVQTTAADKVLWASGTDGHSGVHLELQNDGNLVLYSSSSHVLWASDTNNAQKLVMQSDCNLVLYTAQNTVLWASNTKCAPSPSPGPGPSPPPSPSPSPRPPIVPIDVPGCNSCAFHQVPKHRDYFVGRLPISTTNGKRDHPPGNFGCSMDGWQLALLHMDEWGSHKLSFVKTMLWPNARDDRFPKTAVQGGKYIIDSAYDPTVAMLENELWVSFECAGVNFPGTASCMGPMIGEVGAWELDLGRTQLIVAGTQSVAASVPKIFSFLTRNYMWFDYFQTNHPGYIEARGIELRQDDSGRFWAMGKNGTMGVEDPSAITVWQPSGGDNGVADVFGISVVGKELVVTAGVGPRGCDEPSAPINGCYRVAVARTNFALGQHLANENLLHGDTLPGNAQEYAKFMSQPDGSKLLYAHFLNERSNPGYAIPNGCEGLVLSQDADPGFWTNPCGPDKHYPDWGPRDRECLPSCGGLHGTSSSDRPCTGSTRDMGKAWDTPYCCGSSSAGGHSVKFMLDSDSLVQHVNYINVSG